MTRAYNGGEKKEEKDMGVGQLQGTPWHIETLRKGEDDVRRHRARCVQYEKYDRHCKVFGDGCHGAANCPYYVEREIIEEPKSKSKDKPKGKAVIQTPQPSKKTAKKPSINYKKQYPAGSRVQHPKYGKGMILGVIVVNDNYRVRIKFDDGRKTELSAKACFENNLLRKID